MYEGVTWQKKYPNCQLTVLGNPFRSVSIHIFFNAQNSPLSNSTALNTIPKVPRPIVLSMLKALIFLEAFLVGFIEISDGSKMCNVHSAMPYYNIAWKIF